MYCRNCGKELNEGDEFCTHCGQKTYNPFSNNNKKKNLYIALILSLLFTGLGTIYAGKTKKGLILVALRIIIPLSISLFRPLIILTGVVMIYGIFDAYNEVEIANGNNNPNLIRDFMSLDIYKKITIVVILILVCAPIVAFFTTPEYNVSNDYSGHSSYSSSSSGSGRGSSHSSSHYGGVDTSPSSIANNDPDWYYDYYDYGDYDYYDEYLESEGYD